MPTGFGLFARTMKSTSACLAVTRLIAYPENSNFGTMGDALYVFTFLAISACLWPESKARQLNRPRQKTCRGNVLDVSCIHAITH